jgi:predicted phosphohydrolase
MKVFALSDPHLAFSTPEKKMDRFGEIWIDHPRKIKLNWERTVSPEDVVLIPGDISWARKFEQALDDLRWLDTLPGSKVILKGNHDYWWPKPEILKSGLPPSVQAVKNNSLHVGKFVFFGTRLWDTIEYSCDDVVEWDPQKGEINPKKTEEELEQQEKLYDRELKRLELSIQSLPDDPDLVLIGLCHFPPLNHRLEPSRASRLFASTGARHVVFGHLHSLKEDIDIFGEQQGCEYHLTSGDHLQFKPKLICGE